MEREKVLEKVAQLWCLPQHAKKEMDVEFSKSIVDLILADRRMVMEEAEKPLSEVLRKLPLGYYDVLAQGKEITFLNAIKAALVKIQELKG